MLDNKEYLTPKQIVKELDKYIIGQHDAKRNVAIALRNRWRRLNTPEDIQKDIASGAGIERLKENEAWRRLTGLVRTTMTTHFNYRNCVNSLAYERSINSRELDIYDKVFTNLERDWRHVFLKDAYAWMKKVRRD